MTTKAINIIEIYHFIIFIYLKFVNCVTIFYIIKLSKKYELCFLFLLKVIN